MMMGDFGLEGFVGWLVGWLGSNGWVWFSSPSLVWAVFGFVMDVVQGMKEGGKRVIVGVAFFSPSVFVF